MQIAHRDVPQLGLGRPTKRRILITLPTNGKFGNAFKYLLCSHERTEESISKSLICYEMLDFSDTVVVNRVNFVLLLSLFFNQQT